MTAPASLTRDLLLTAVAPVVWGTTYIVTTQFLPPDRPLTVAALRALPAGLLLLLVLRAWPRGMWIGRVVILGSLNFAIFWALLFVSVYRLPGGVAATLGAIQPLIVLALERLVIGSTIRAVSIVVGLAGVAGVALLVLTPRAALDGVGVAAGLGAAAAMAAGTVLSKLWRPPVSPLVFTGWQLTAGGVMLAPLALLVEGPPPALSGAHVAGLAWLGLIGAAATYALWFRGLARLPPSVVSPLALLSPVVATAIGLVALGETLTALQWLGMALALGAVWLNSVAARRLTA